jgi:hypothetical protein
MASGCNANNVTDNTKKLPLIINTCHKQHPVVITNGSMFLQYPETRK